MMIKELRQQLPPDAIGVDVETGMGTQEPCSRACAHSEISNLFSPDILTFTQHLEIVEIRHV